MGVPEFPNIKAPGISNQSAITDVVLSIMHRLPRKLMYIYSMDMRAAFFLRI
jgi:hypothetical protein